MASGRTLSMHERLNLSMHERLKQWCRILLLLEALERAGLTPVPSRKLHGFAYLADVLSPVWGLKPFDGKVMKIHDGPHYAQLQRELDQLVIMGLVDARDLRYVPRGVEGARIDGNYCLNFDSDSIWPILEGLGAVHGVDALVAEDKVEHAYLVELACALTSMPDDQLDIAAQADVTYSDRLNVDENVIDISGYRDRQNYGTNKSVEVTSRFEEFVPEATGLSPGEKIYLYATLLGRRISNG